MLAIPMTLNQQNKSCQSFISQIHGSPLYDQVKMLLFQWKDKNKSPISTISAFVKIAEAIRQNDQQFFEEFNKCLVKEFPSEKRQEIDEQQIKTVAYDNPQSHLILDSIITWVKTEQDYSQNMSSNPITGAPTVQNSNRPYQIEELSESEFVSRLERHHFSKDIAKIIFLYRRSIITLKEFKSLLEPIYLGDPSFFNMLFQFSQETEIKRRKVTIFAPLNELVDQKYPMDQVGNSYVIIPDGYANWSRNWKKNELEVAMNRLCVSVPLGSEVSFVITRKNQYQEQLFKNQEEKYELDSNIQCLKATIRLIQLNKKLSHPLIQRILANIYPVEILNVIIKSQNPEISKVVIMPRLQQKLHELLKCRTKFEKNCEQINSKNFYKSLDYRCFYFCKNDKKFNCQQRWEKEIEMRKKQIVHENDEYHEEEEHQIEDRESLQRPRNYIFNSFENITKQEFLENRKIQFNFQRKSEPTFYPRFPHNQILFLIGFENEEVLNDVLEVLLWHCQKKSLLEMMIFKILRKDIDRKLLRNSNAIQFIDLKLNLEGENSNQLPTIFSTNTQLLNQAKQVKKTYKDINDQFYDLIEEDIQATHMQEYESPFEGPEASTFIGTKTNYFFIRFLGTIYQRFLKAKQLLDERQRGKYPRDGQEEPSLYQQFLAIVIYKLKEQKSFEEYLRKILQQDAFIFFTLDKLIGGTTKLINNIGNDTLTYKILKQGIKDYDLEIKKWSDFTFPSIVSQLSRVYKETELLFRFTYSSSEKLVFISAWQNIQGSQEEIQKKKKDAEIQSKVKASILKYMCEVAHHLSPSEVENLAKPKKSTKQKLKWVNNECDHYTSQKGSLILQGEFTGLNIKRRAAVGVSDLEKEIGKSRKIMKLI